MRLPVVAGAALLLAQGVTLAQDAEIRIRSAEVVPGLYMLDGADDQFAGGNMGLLMGDDGVILIDDGLEVVGPALLAAIAELAGKPVDFLINTHAHGDHVGSNLALYNHGAVIMAHENIRRSMAAATGDEAAPAGALPSITYGDGVNIYKNGIAIRVIHVASAHTDGDSILYFPDINVIHTGDVLFNGLFPFIDLDGGGSVPGYLAALNSVLALSDANTKIIPGHGPLGGRADAQRARDVLADCLARVKQLVDEGRSEEEIVAANPLDLYHDDWNWGFITTERMTRTLVRSLSR